MTQPASIATLALRIPRAGWIWFFATKNFLERSGRYLSANSAFPGSIFNIPELRAIVRIPDFL